MVRAVVDPFKSLVLKVMGLNRGRIIGIVSLAALVLVSCSNAGPADSVQQAEDLAPDFEIALFGNENHTAGETFSMSDLKGKPVVLNFWFPSCPPCVAEMPDLQHSFERHEGDVEFVGVQLVGLDTLADGQAFVEQLGVTYALGPDEGAIIRDYSVAGFPTTVFIDKDQRIVRKWTGILNEEKLEELVAEILN